MQRIKPVLSKKVEKVEKKEEAAAATEHTCGQSKKEEAVNTVCIFNQELWSDVVLMLYMS